MTECLDLGYHVYGTMLFTTPSRPRFIGVIVTPTHIECAVCAAVLAARASHTATSILHPIAVHWMVSPDVVAVFSRIYVNASSGDMLVSNL